MAIVSGMSLHIQPQEIMSLNSPESYLQASTICYAQEKRLAISGNLQAPLLLITTAVGKLTSTFPKYQGVIRIEQPAGLSKRLQIPRKSRKHHTRRQRLFKSRRHSSTRFIMPQPTSPKPQEQPNPKHSQEQLWNGLRPIRYSSRPRSLLQQPNNLEPDKPPPNSLPLPQKPPHIPQPPLLNPVLRRQKTPDLSRRLHANHRTTAPTLYTELFKNHFQRAFEFRNLLPLSNRQGVIFDSSR